MRRPIKLRIVFIIMAVICFGVGTQLTPEHLSTSAQQVQLALICASYFVVLPILYWLWIIQAGQQPKWKLIIIFSLSSLVARFTFPAEIASYFEFIAWLRFPIIAVLLVIELYLIVTVVRGLWQARNLKGDPRINVLEQYKDKDDKTRTLGLLMAMEPANWMYAVPWFSRNHIPSIATIPLLSRHIWHLLLLSTACLIWAAMTYFFIVSWSELVAIIVSSIIAYTLVMLVANYRVAKHYSLYIQDDKLIVNNGLWGFLIVPLASIEKVEQGEFERGALSELLCIGRGKQLNLKLSFNQELTYHGGGGQLPEPIKQAYLVVDNPKVLIDSIAQHQAAGVSL